MQNYNLLIKNERVKKNMTQKALANGICSTSYLSKIEKEHVIPRKNIQNQLLQRLDLNINLLKISEEERFLKELYIAYQQVIFINTMEHAQIAWNHFNEFNIEFSDSKEFYLCNLYLQRIAIIARQPILETAEIEEAFLAILDKLTIQQQFIYYVNCAHNNLLQLNHEKSIKNIKKAQQLIASYKHDIEQWLVADFHLLSSSIYHSIFQYSIAIVHANIAVELFKQLNLEIPLINAYIHLGISTNRSGHFEEAHREFETAYNLALQYEKRDLYGKILQNLGNTASLLEHPKKAIAYYKKSLNYKKAIEPRLISIHSIINEYSKLNSTIHLKKWCEQGLRLIVGLENKPRFQSYFYQFKIFEMIHEIKPLDDDFIKEAIDFFLHSNDYLNLQKYTYVIATIYLQQEKFELATKYLKCSSEIGFKIQSRQHWQDI